MNHKIAVMPEIITFEEARLTDLPTIIQLLNQLVPEQKNELGLMLVDLSESIKSNYNKWFVIRLNGQTVACCQLVIYRNLIRSPYKKAIIDSVIVDENYQYIGIGRILIKKTLEYARENNVGKVQLISSYPRVSAHSFYEKLNFKNVGYGFILDLNSVENQFISATA